MSAVDLREFRQPAKPARFLERVAPATQQLDEPAVDDPDHLLAGLQALGHLLADRVGQHIIDERVNHIVIDIRLDQRGPHIRQRLLHVGLADRALARELAVDVAEGF
jgi:hypothetical protein